MKKNIPLLALTAFTCFMISCETKNEKKAPTEAVGSPFCLKGAFKEQLTLEEVKKMPVTETISLTGSIQYNEDDVIIFKSMLDGIVENVQFTLGQYVHKGDVLATVKSPEMGNMAQEKQSILNEITVARQKVVSSETMLADGLASQRQVEEAKMELATLQSSLQNVNNNLHLYNATEQKGVFQIKAPKSGYVVEKNINPGMNIGKDQENLFALSDLNQIWVMVNIYANNLPYIKKGAPVKVKTLAYPDTYFTGRIMHISNVFDQEERVLKARVVLDNADLRLKPGMSADIIIDKSAGEEYLIAIPNHAIIFDNNKKYAVIYKSDCDLQIRKIIPAAENNQYTYVKEGFNENEKVVTQNELLIFEELNK